MALQPLELLQNLTRTAKIDLVEVILCASVPDAGSDAYDTAYDAYYDSASDTRLMCMTHTVRCVSDMVSDVYQTCTTKMSDVYDTGKTR